MAVHERGGRQDAEGEKIEEIVDCSEIDELRTLSEVEASFSLSREKIIANEGPRTSLEPGHLKNYRGYKVTLIVALKTETNITNAYLSRPHIHKKLVGESQDSQQRIVQNQSSFKETYHQQKPTDLKNLHSQPSDQQSAHQPPRPPLTHKTLFHSTE